LARPFLTYGIPLQAEEGVMVEKDVKRVLNYREKSGHLLWARLRGRLIKEGSIELIQVKPHCANCRIP